MVIYSRDLIRPTIIANSRRTFRDGFVLAGSPDPALWDIRNDGGKHIINQGGNSNTSSYVRLSLSPFDTDSTVSITSKDYDLMPFRAGFGVTLSQRILGQEIGLEMVGIDDNKEVALESTPAAMAITGATITIASNVAPITLTNHGLLGGDRVIVYGCAEPRLNVGPVLVTVIDANTFSVPCTLANGAYSTAGGYVALVSPFDGAINAAGYLFENATVTNATLANKRNGSSFRLAQASTVTTTSAVQANTSPYTDAFLSAANYEMHCNLDEVSFRSFPSDGVATPSGLLKRTQGVPDHTKNYKLRVRAKNLKNLTVPIAQIVTIAKTGTTTATVTTDVPHELTISDFVQISGVRDVTNFPYLAAATVVASVIDETNFTVVMAGAVSASSSGGVVWKVQGSVLAPGINAISAAFIVRANNVLTVTGSGTWAGFLPGEYVQLHGMTDTAVPYNSAYKVLKMSTSSLELESVGADFESISTGGAVIKRTDVRLHFVRVLDYTRLVAEISGGRGNTTDINNAVPVALVGGATQPVSGSLTTAGTVTQSTGINTTMWSAGGWGGFSVNDVVSAAITTTATTAAITPGSLANVGTYAHSFNITVTASTGTNQTMDVGIEESFDNGTNWVRIYDFERITAVGAYVSPLIRSQFGTRFRYVQTIAGTSPSFTRAINRAQFSSNGALFRRFIDRSVAPNTASSNTPTYLIEGCNTFQLIVNMGAITTTAPQFTLYGSEDGASWYVMGTAVTAVASSTVAGNAITGLLPKFVRATVSTQGSGATMGFVVIKATGN